jgi:ADP-ribose pyrophosphatase YjhB (NUDIX family)
MADPDWLVWAREIQAIAQTGLTFSKDPYDLDRFAALRRLSARIMAEHTGAELGRIEGLFDAETGYATPKVGVRGAVFDAAGRILMVRETADEHRWTLPGGWADVNQTPAQSVVREVFEESGYHVRAVKLAAVWDRSRHTHPATTFSVVRMFFVCAGGWVADDQPGNERGRLVRGSRCANGSVFAANVTVAYQPDVRALAGSGVGDGVRLNGAATYQLQYKNCTCRR